MLTASQVLERYGLRGRDILEVEKWIRKGLSAAGLGDWDESPK